MERKLVIFIAFATLTQSFGAQDSGSYGLSESGTAQLRDIIDNQDKALSTGFFAVHPIFDLIEILSTTRRYNLQLGEDGISAFIGGALLTAKNSSDYTINSISVIRGKACHDAEIVRNTAHGDLEIVYAHIGSAVELAVSGNHTDIRTQFEVFSVEAVKSLHNLKTKIFNTIRSCVQTTNPGTLDEIKLHENGSLDGLLRANNAVFDAIKVFAAGILAEGDSVAVIPDIKAFRKKAIIGVQNVVEQTYSSIRGLYISAQLNRPESAARLISDQYAQIVSDSGYAGGAETILDVSKGFLNRVHLGLSDRCNDDSSAIDAAQAETAAYFRSGLDTIVKSVSTPDSVLSPAAVDELKLFQFSDNAAAAYFKALRLAQGQGLTHSETIEQINTVEAELQAAFPDIVHKIFNIVQLGSTPQDQLTNLRSNAAAAVRAYVDDIFVGIRLMAKACHGVEAVSETDFNVIQNATNDVSHLADRFNSDVSSGHVTAIKTLYKISTTIPTAIPIVSSAHGTQLLTVRLGVGFTFS